MQSLKRFFALFMSAVFLLTGLTGNASAALQAVGPTDVVTTLPTWYRDPGGLALQPCLDQNGFCILTPLFDPAFTFPPNSITTTGPINDVNFPDESFYFIADALMNVGPALGGKAKFRVALEAAFLAGVSPDTGITFLRLQLAKIPSGLTPNSTFTVTHPYGSFTFQSDATGASVSAGAATFRVEDPIAAAPGIFFPPEMQAATTTHIGPFLRASTGLIVDPVSGNSYIGNPATPTTVTGSPTGNNFFRIDGPNIGGQGINRIQTPLFTLAGKVYTGSIASPMTIDRATFARDATSGQLDVFATALPTATLTISGVGIPATVMTQDVPNSGKFYAHIPLASSDLPTSVAIANSLDTPAPIPHPVTLVDEVNIAQSYYDPAANTLTIKADSRDNLAPLPVLSVPAFAAPNTLDATGTVVIPLATTIPPASISVASSHGGRSTRSVSVFTPAPAPVALADTATTLAGAPVTISVLANDTIAAPGIIDTGSILVTTAPLSGFAIADANGTVTYVPAPGFTGNASFTYVVANTEGTDSNAATVTVTVNAAAPIAAADTATTTAGTAVTIPVLANDTIALPGVINTGSVVIAGVPLNGTAVVNAAGAVTFTPAASFTGTTSFTYTVANTQGVVSNAATVTVTVNAAAPIAVADTATTTAGTAVTIPVLANDTIALPGVINTGSVVIAGVPLNGTAVANAAGTVIFTPAAGFTGTTSFTYTVKNTAGAVSNAATVTVTVSAPAPAPVAVADTATTTAGTAVTIPVLANDTIALPGVINTGSVVIASAPLNGTAVANLTGTVSFTPAVGFTGTTSFTYTVKNTAGAVSNAATVTVTVNAAAAPAPVAVADTATTAAGTAVTIPVLANDTIALPGVVDTGSVVIASAPLNGTAVANLTGTVTFTPAAGFTGTTSFTYTVKNTQGAVSNAATVTVTVTAAAAETVNAQVVEYVRSKAQWRVGGTTSNATAHTMTLKLTGVVAGAACNADGRVIGTTSASRGNFVFLLTGATGPLDPTTTNCNAVRVESSLGGVDPSTPIVLK